jgi:hypothetical protein
MPGAKKRRARIVEIRLSSQMAGAGVQLAGWKAFSKAEDIVAEKSLELNPSTRETIFPARSITTTVGKDRTPKKVSSPSAKTTGRASFSFVTNGWTRDSS